MTRLAAWWLRIAGASGVVSGLGFGGFAIPAIVSVGHGHGIIYTFGNPAYGNGPLARIGVPTTVPLLAGFLAACVGQVAGGVLLLWPRPSGIRVSVVGMLLGAAFWWGFDLPFAWLNAAVVLAFLILAWTALKGSSRGPRGGGRSSVPGNWSSWEKQDGQHDRNLIAGRAWSLPGGKVEEGESLSAALVRGVEFVELADLPSLGFTEKFGQLALAGFPGAGSYMGAKSNIGL